MNYASLQSSLVTGSARIITTGPSYFWGYRIDAANKFAGCTLVVSDSAQSTVTVAASGSSATDIKAWVALSSSSRAAAAWHISNIFPEPLKCAEGLRAKFVNHQSAVTCVLHWGG